jgi:DNA-binding CsgD family transcriptional regulator
MIEVKVVDKGPLTKREAELLAMIAEGRLDAAIAIKLYRSRKTIENHLSNIYEKLDVKGSSINSRSLAITKGFANSIIAIHKQ